jgi:hypothetical protein
MSTIVVKPKKYIRLIRGRYEPRQMMQCGRVLCFRHMRPKTLGDEINQAGTWYRHSRNQQYNALYAPRCRNIIDGLNGHGTA